MSSGINDSTGRQAQRDRRKLRRRGDRLVVTFGDERVVFAAYKGRERRIIEWSMTDEHYAITYSGCGRYTMATGHRRDEPLQAVFDGLPFRRMAVAVRGTDDEAWVFRHPDPDVEKLRVPFSETGSVISNCALALSTVVGRVDPDLATFLNVGSLLCDLGDIKDIHDNPRYKALRDFKFDFTVPDHAVGNGRRAENTVRHQHTNYDEMLRTAGGLLWPEQYDRLRRGVNMVVQSVIAEVAP